MQDKLDGYETIITTGKHLHVSQDALSLHELVDLVQASVSWWEQQVKHARGGDREHAAAAIRDLSLILASLAQQVAQGRETVRITRRLPSVRRYSIGCPVCGHGNRAGARFCKACGSALLEQEQSVSLPLLPMQRVDTAACSDRGKKREKNEDTYAMSTITTPQGVVTLLLVADGMGGAQAGEHASRLASETVQQALQQALQQDPLGSDAEWQALLRRVVEQANSVIHEQALANSRYYGMGTTLTFAVVAEKRAHIAHVGDSRLFLINMNGVTDDGAPVVQLSSDHSLVARLVDIGQLTPEEARVHPHRNMLYRALGVEAVVEVDVSSQPVGAGDHLLCCSDGLTNYVEEAELAHVVLVASTLDEACARLVALANERGGCDNISVVLGQVVGNQ